MNKLITISLIALISIFFVGCDKEKDKEKIEESTEIPIANFHASPQYGPAPLTVKFSDQSLHRPTSWLWTLGDNSTSTAQNPTRTYNSEGVYSVTLTVTNGIGSDTKMNTNYITVGPSNTPPNAYLKVNPYSGTINTLFKFDASISSDDYDPIGDLLIRWDFDGNGTWDTDWSTESIIIHQFNTQGNFNSKLQVKDSYGLIDQANKTIRVAGNEQPNAHFVISHSSGFINQNIVFDASSSIDDGLESLQYRWDFDGNGTWDTDWSTNKVQQHQYANPNNYDATLEVKDNEGLTDTYTKSIIVYSGCEGESTLSYAGQTYEVTEIGFQCWMTENLNYETGSGSWWYDNDDANGQNYGRLYTWEAAMEACPDGWRLPSDEDYKILEMTLGMSETEAFNTSWRGTNQGEKMKSIHGWNSNGNGTNSSGFNAFPGGYRSDNGNFNGLGSYGNWWTSSTYINVDAWRRTLSHDFDQVYRNGNSSDKTNAYSVRCVR